MYLTETKRLLRLLVSSTCISGGYCTTQTRLLLCHCVTHLTEMHCPRSFCRTPSSYPQHKFKVKALGCPDMVVNVGIRSVEDNLDAGRLSGTSCGAHKACPRELY